MANITSFRKTKGDQKTHPLSKPSKGYGENVLTPVNLYGVVVPWRQELSGGKESDYKLVCSSGMEYFLVADQEWQGVFSWYCWEEVRVIGLLNLATKTIIPQKVFPKGPTGEKENVIDLAIWKSREAIKKAIKNINDMVVIPAAVLAVMAR
ncbi:MAG: hypothetical protein AAGB31_13255 [Bdellovibrio sp.]